MKAFDTDILSELFRGTPQYVQRAAATPVAEQSISVIVVEEVLRGRLNVIRRADAGRARTSIERAYDLFQKSISCLQQFVILSYSSDAEELYKSWRQQRIRVGTRDLRIAATCVAHGATLVSRNRRDFELVPNLLVPNLSVEFWA
jgi:tRNA(fMet)-specific endonuclease VapC